MVVFPSAIIVCNEDISASVRTHLIRQLHINDVQDGYEWDANVATDPSYPDKIRQLNLRVLVLRSFIGRGTVPSWPEYDVAIFVKNGLAAVEKNLFGDHGLTLPVIGVYWGALGIFDRKV